MHDFHHSAFTGVGLKPQPFLFSFLPAPLLLTHTQPSLWRQNYGATIIWDRLMGTENPLYKKIRLGKMENIYNA